MDALASVPQIRQRHLTPAAADLSLSAARAFGAPAVVVLALPVFATIAGIGRLRDALELWRRMADTVRC